MAEATIHSFIGHWLPKLEAEMQQSVAADSDELADHYGMLRYHMGWVDAAFQPASAGAGKRLRPVFCLLACSEVGGDPADALSAAAAIELLHNFSLIHDDIEDGDEERRHRPTVWKHWGIAQGINAGDGMFALSYMTLHRLRERGIAADKVLDVHQLFTSTCIRLTEGQFLDMRFEQRERVEVDEYMRMISGKTAALIGAAIAIGAHIGGATPEQDDALRRFGEAMGLAFQIQDDILGIWGDPAVTGKAAGNDILRRKKTLPLLHALNDPRIGADLRELLAGDLSERDLPRVMALFEESGTRGYVDDRLRHYHDMGIAALGEALGERAAGSALMALSDSLLHRAA